jgi:hypothetical protein
LKKGLPPVGIGLDFGGGFCNVGVVTRDRGAAKFVKGVLVVGGEMRRAL